MIGLALLLACRPGPAGPADTADAGPETWHTRDGGVYDPAGRRRILYGVNVSNDVKWTPYESWAGPEDYARLAGWGYSVVRLLTAWAAIMPEEGVVDEDYLDLYEARVDLAADAGLLVIVDMHQDIFGEGFVAGGGDGAPRWACDEQHYAGWEPLSPWYLNYLSEDVQACYDRFWTDTALQDRYTEAFVALAERLAGREAVVGWDLMNEPHWGSATPDAHNRDLLQPFYERLMPALDAVAPGRLFFVEPNTAVQFCLDPGFEPFAGFADAVVYAPHYYHPGVHDNHEYDGDPSPMEAVTACYEETASGLGVPWFMGELGGYTDSVGFEQYMRDLMGLLDGYQAGDTYWEYSLDTDGFSPLDDEGNEKPELLDVHARVYPKAVAGELVEYGFDDLAHTFTMSWTPDGPAVLAFPAARHFPDGFVVEPDEVAWTWDEAATELILTAPAGEPVVVTVSPASRAVPAPGPASL